MPQFRTMLAAIVLLLLLWTCGPSLLGLSIRQQYLDANAALFEQARVGRKFLKAHLHQGDLMVFDPDWYADPGTWHLTGTGRHYDLHRRVIGSGPLKVHVDSIALIETNANISSRDPELLGALIGLTLLNAIPTIYCATNPKACFGSCPTFYLPGDEGLFQVRAEGFSSAIHPGLQYADLDRLGDLQSDGAPPEVIMKNEAFETHVVDRLWLQAYPKIPGEEVHMDQHDQAYRCGVIERCARARYKDEDVTGLIAYEDGCEWWSKAAAGDMRTEGSLEIVFDPIGHACRQGLLLTYRQTLLTTFLLYTAFGHMGVEVSDHLAHAMRNKEWSAKVGGPLQRLQQVRVQLFQDGRWSEVGTFKETGPIAHNRLVIPLPVNSGPQGPVRVRLLFTPGMYRFDRIGLVEILGEAEGRSLALMSVTEHCAGERDASLLQQRDGRKLAAVPGDVHRLSFEAPQGDACDWTLFLGADGYYLEWMRTEWMQRTDPMRLRAMMTGDADEWEALTREYKAMETSMDEVFWNSQHPTPL